MIPVAVDYESFYSSRLRYTLKLQIAEQYCQHELFDPYLIAVSDGASSWAGTIKDFNWASIEGKLALAHNSYFDETVTAELDRRGWKPAGGPADWHCTANLSSYLCGRRSLEHAVEHLFKVKLDKSARGDANNKRWADYNEADRKKMLGYAQKDAYYCWKIWNDYSHKWPTVERRLSQITTAQGRRGVQINVDLLNDYIGQTHEMRYRTEKMIPWIHDSEDEDSEGWEEFNTKPTSTKCIAEQCRRTRIPCPPVKSDDEEGYQEWEDEYGPRHPWIYAVSAWRSINKLYKTFLVVKERLRPDGTMPFGLKYFGAHTGRWSGESRVNMQNMRKDPILCNEHGLLEMNPKREEAALKYRADNGKWPEWVRYAIDFRNLIIPRPGKKMIVSDLSQIEPRVLAWLCGDTAMLELLAKGMSPYEAHARQTMKWTGGDMKKENPKLYALAKARVLALGYGAGWEKFISMAWAQAKLDITEGDPEWVEEFDREGNSKQVSGYGQNSRAIVKDFRDNSPKITGLWKSLDERFRRSIGEDFVMTLPSGRQMRYERVRCETRMEKNKTTGMPEKRSVFTANIGEKRVMTYGGKLTENITQAVARDVLAEQIVQMEDNGWTNLYSIHDEAVLEVDQDVTAEEVEHAMSLTPDWLKGCPVGAEAKEVTCYQK